MAYRDRKRIIDFLDMYPQADIIVDIPIEVEDIDWDFFENMSRIAAGKNQTKLIVALGKLGQSNREASQRGILWYYRYPINSFYEAERLKVLGSHSILIDSPLSHSMEDLKYLGFHEVRIVPNIAYYAHIPHVNGVIGSYIRPEDIDAYGGYINVIEFEGCDKKKEQALYRIYAEQKAWPGDLKTIITNLDYPGVNRMIPENFALKRMNCGQTCITGAHCKLCYRYLDLANPDLLREYK